MINKKVVVVVIVSLLLLIAITGCDITGSTVFKNDNWKNIKFKGLNSCIDECGKEPQQHDQELYTQWQVCVVDCNPNIAELNTNSVEFSCSETDNANDFYTAGQTTLYVNQEPIIQLKDFCVSNQLLEVHCEGNQIVQNTEYCSHGCLHGKCNEPPNLGCCYNPYENYCFETTAPDCYGTEGLFLGQAACNTYLECSQCSPGLTNCLGECVDLNSDHFNCGECGFICDESMNYICSSGECVLYLHCTSDNDCNDENFCTLDQCDESGTCQNPPNNDICNDDDLCTNDFCDQYDGCYHTFACDDGNPCTDDSCASDGGCTHTYNTNPCGGEGGICQDGICSN